MTIADLVADVRAATPSAAAELITPDRGEVIAWLDQRRGRMSRALAGQARELRLRLGRLAGARCFRRPDEPVREAERRVDELVGRLGRAGTALVKEFRSRLAAAGGKLEVLSPLKVLARGYSVTWNGETLVRSVGDVNAGDRIRTLLPDGEIESIVED